MALVNIRKKLQIEITVTMPDGSVQTFSEADVIHCVVSLRSDLSTINPTLPESEFEVDLYGASLDELADLPDETAITYRTKAPASLWSITRYFYTDEITYSEKVLHIHARDQVHKLDEEIAPLYIGQTWRGNANKAYSRGLQYLYWLFEDVIAGTANAKIGNSNKIEHLAASGMSNSEGTFSTGDQVNAIIERGTRRDIIANLMNLCRFDFASGFLNGRTSFYLNYVDAGSPSISNSKSTTSYTIYEEDCGNIKVNRDKNISRYNFRVRDVMTPNTGNYYRTISDGGAVVYKETGIKANYEGYLYQLWYGVRVTKEDEANDYQVFYMMQVNDDYGTRSRPYNSTYTDTDAWRQSNKYGQWLLDQDVDNNAFSNGGYGYIDLTGYKWTSELHGPSGYEWTVQQRWNYFVTNGYFDNASDSATLDMYGYYFNVTDEQIYSILTSLPGAELDVEAPIWNGRIYTVGYNDNKQRIRVLPDMGLYNLTKRSNITGSFIWRGNGNMQPRQYIKFYLIEKKLLTETGAQLTDENGNELIIGGYEDRTIETITTTHEKGGTVSEITYRKGKV